MHDKKDYVWMLKCKNQKCKATFDYFGRLNSNSGIRLHALRKVLETQRLIF